MSSGIVQCALPLLVLVLVLSSQDARARQPTGAEWTTHSDAHADQVARFMAGLPQLDPDSPYVRLEAHQAWREHRGVMDKYWDHLEKENLGPMRQWQREEFSQMTGVNLPVFYPFSGPDFVTAHTLYPTAPRYVFVALESVRYPPDFFSMSPPFLWKALRGMVHALRDLYAVGYFITSHMQDDLVQRASEGAVPSIYVFLARTGNQLLSAEQVTVGANGVLREVSGFQRGMIRGMRMRFRKRGAGVEQELIYFDVNLKDHSLDATPEFVTFIKSLGPTHTFVKAASYLMATRDFSGIRSLVLEVSRTLFQDDTGVPLRALEPSRWAIELFGSYTRPISGFGNYTYQPDLMELYASSRPAEIQHLPFSMGYHPFGKRKQNQTFVTRKIQCPMGGRAWAPTKTSSSRLGLNEEAH